MTVYLIFNEFYEFIEETTDRRKAEKIARKVAGYIEEVAA